MQREALFSPCGAYRYRLARRWAEGPMVAFIMLNPSTADGSIDDPTIRRCIGYAQTWGYGALAVGNLYALRATEPAELRRARDPTGPDNDRHLEGMTRAAARVVCAWGADPAAHTVRTDAVIGLLLRCHSRLMALRLLRTVGILLALGFTEGSTFARVEHAELCNGRVPRPPAGAPHDPDPVAPGILERKDIGRAACRSRTRIARRRARTCDIDPKAPLPDLYLDVGLEPASVHGYTTRGVLDPIDVVRTRPRVAPKVLRLGLSVPAVLRLVS
ncbi:MAG TPA: DUF1643 domain-containing protein [Microvirga sp.]|nr:DUF1643 domain-containing protein [Microvirga sp.]